MYLWKKQAIAIMVIASMSIPLPSFVSAYDYSSYTGLPFSDPLLIPASSKTSDQTKKMDELKQYLQDPATVLGALPKAESHPSLWFHEGNLPSYQSRKALKGSYYEKLWSKLKSDVDSVYIHYDYTDPKLHENDRSRGAKLLAFFYMMIKDDPSYSESEKRLVLTKAKDATIHMYTGTVAARTKDDGDIYWATYLQDYAAAYDWLQPYFSEGDEKQARSRLKAEATFIADWLMTPQPPRPHNHRSKPALGLGTVALTLSAEPEAQYWMNLAIERTHNVFDFQFSSDGITREGAHYAEYTFVNLIPFLWQYKNLIGGAAPANLSPDTFIQRVQPMFEYALQTRMANGWLPSTEDSYVKPFPTHMVAGLYKEADGTKFGQGLKLSELFQWNYQNTQVYIPDYTGATSQYEIAIDEYLTYDASIAPKRPTASRTRFLNGGINPKTNQPYGGIAVLGNQWNSVFEPQGKDTLWLTFNGVPESDNHQHQDQLHYNIFAKNALFANDTGYGQYSAFASTLKTPQSHNVVTMNGRGVKNETDPMQTVLSQYEMDTPYFDFAQKSGSFYADDSSVMGTHTRGIAFPGQQYFVVADQLSSSMGKANFNMYLHSLGKLNVGGNNARWTISRSVSPELTNAPDPASANVLPNYALQEAKMETYIFPQTAKIETKEGVTSLFKEDIKEQYIEVPQQAEKAQFLTLLVPQSLSEQAPAVQDLSTERYTAARLTKGEQTDTYLLKEPNTSSAAAGHLTTDASFAWLRENGTVPADVMLREGRSVSIHGSKWIASPTPVTLVQHMTEASWSGTVSDLNQETRIAFTIPSGVKVTGVMVAGQKLNRIEVKDNVLTIPFKQSAEYSIQLDGKAAYSAPPAAQIKADQASAFGLRGKGTRSVSFSGLGSTGKGLQYAWSFGDGTTSDKPAPVKEFTKFGKFLIHLQVTDEAGRIDTQTLLIDNKDPNQPPVADVKANVTSGRPPLQVTFDASASTDPDTALGDKIVKYEWDFGDGTPVQSGSNLKQISHIFHKVGSMQVKLTVTDQLGASNRFTMPISAGSPYGYIEVAKKQPDDEQIYVLFEAEDYTFNSSTKQDQISTESGTSASGGQFVKFGKNVPDLTDKDVVDPAYKDTMPADKVLQDMVYVEYELKVKDPGSFQAHIFSTGDSASNGSVMLQWDNSDLKRITLKDKDWKRAYDNFQYQLSEGIHTLRIYSRKGGADMDRILIMTDGTSHTKVQSTIIPKVEQTYPVSLFHDIQGHWARNDIHSLAAKKVISSTGSGGFLPNDSISSKELADWLNKVPGVKASSAEGAQVTLSRMEAVTQLVKALESTGRSIQLTDTELAGILSAYGDLSNLNKEQRKAVGILLKTGILNGTSPSTISPNTATSRAQAAVMINRLLEYTKAL